MDCKKLLILMVFCSCFSSNAFSQSPSIVSGTITDAGNNFAVSGTVEFDIQPTSPSVQYYVPGVATLVPTTVTCNIVNGSLFSQSGGACMVWPNTLIAPANTTYNVTFAPNGQVTGTVSQECISTFAYNLNNPVFCPVVSIIPQYSTITAPVINGNLIPQVSNVFTIGNPQAYYANIYVDNITLPNVTGTGCLVTGGTTLTTGPCVVENPTTSQEILQPPMTSFGASIFAQTYYASAYTGADAFAKANNAATLIPAAGGTIIMDFGPTTQTVTTQLSAVATKPVAIQFQQGTQYILNTAFSTAAINSAISTGNSGVAGPCMIPLGSGSSITTLGWNGGPFNLKLGPNARTYDVICNAFMDGTEESFSINGLGIQGNASATMAGSLIHLRNLYVQTLISNVVTTNPYGNILTDDSGSDHIFFNNSFTDSASTGGYPGANVTINCGADFTFIGGAIQFNGVNNPLLVINGSDPQLPDCPLGSASVGMKFYQVDFETQAATVGLFQGAPTNVDPIQITDAGFVWIDNLIQYGLLGAGQQHLVDIMSSGSNGQLRGPIEINNIGASLSHFSGKSIIHNTVGAPYVSPVQADVFGTQNNATLTIGEYKWEGNGTTNASSIDYEDYKNFSSVTSGIENGSFIVGPSYPSIQDAGVAASTTGAVTIPPFYTGTDAWANPNALTLNDLRPLSASNAVVQTVDAAQFGAQCKGVGHSDDTAALRAALTLPYVYNQPIATNVYLDVVMPQGSCVITQPLQLGYHGSLVGQGDATYLVANYQSWVGADYNAIEMTSAGANPGGASVGARRISNFNLIGVSCPGGPSACTIPSATGIYISNTSNNYDPTNYAFNNLNIDHMKISGFDTAINAQDLVNSSIDYLNITTVRLGIYLNGDVQNVFIHDNTITNGSWVTSSNHSSTIGLDIVQNTKYSVNCGSTKYCAPQGIFLHDSAILSFDDNLNIGQCNQCNITDNTIDQAGEGPVGSGASIQLGAQATGGSGLWIARNTIGTGQVTNGYDIYSQAATTPGNNGIWITDNYFILDAGLSPTSVYGINFSGSAAIYQAKITGNIFYNLTDAIITSQPIVDGVIRDNTGSGITTDFINLSNASSLVHANTIIDGNSDSDSIPIVYEGTATGFMLGFNISGNVSSPTQLTGTQRVSTSGCTISAGAIGNTCGTATTLTWPQPFADSSYTFQCALQSPSFPTGIGVAGIVNGASISVNEVALSTSSVGGGTIVCTGTHQ